MNILLSHPTGSTFVRALANKLVESNLLYKYYTSLAVFDGSILHRIGGLNSFKDIRRKEYSLSLKKYTKTFPQYEFGRLISPKIGLRQLTRHEDGIFSVDSIYHKLDRKVASAINHLKNTSISHVYAYEDGALETFKAAKKKGIKCVYDLPIAYWEYGHKLLKEEAERLPEWAITLAGGIKDSTRKCERKVEELKLADIIVTPGSFVSDSLPEWAKEKIVIESPFGTPAGDTGSERSTYDKKRPLRVLFAGSMGQRKGLGDLFNAIKLLNRRDIELVVLGSPLAPLEFYYNELPKFRHEKVRPHHEVLKLMRSCDIFCLPSIVEGRALVMQEAMSQGLPIIITPNTGGKDLVIEGETGFLVPIRSPQAIAEKINWFAENKDRLPAMSEKARQKALLYTWEQYSEKIIESIAK